MTMLEKVAKALFECHYKEPYARYSSGVFLFGTENPTWEMATGPNVVPELAESWRVQARAAINAMREPSDLPARLRLVADDLITGKNVAAAALLCVDAAIALERFDLDEPPPS